MSGKKRKSGKSTELTKKEKESFAKPCLQYLERMERQDWLRLSHWLTSAAPKQSNVDKYILRLLTGIKPRSFTTK